MRRSRVQVDEVTAPLTHPHTLFNSPHIVHQKSLSGLPSRNIESIADPPPTIIFNRFFRLKSCYRTHWTRSTIGSPACRTTIGLPGLVLLSVLSLAILGLTGLVLLSVLPLAIPLPDSRDPFYYRFSRLQYCYRTHCTRSTISSPA